MLLMGKSTISMVMFHCYGFSGHPPMVQGSTADTKRSATTDNCRWFNGKIMGKTWGKRGKNIGKFMGKPMVQLEKNIARHVCLFLLGTGGYGKSPLGTGPRPGSPSWTCPNDPNLSSSGDFPIEDQNQLLESSKKHWVQRLNL